MRVRPLKRSTLTIAGSQDTEALLPRPLFASSLSAELEHAPGHDTNAPHSDFTRGGPWAFVNLLERIAASILLFVLLPLLFLIAALVCLFSRRSPLVAHLRVGRNGRELWVLKFRTMWDGSASPLPKNIVVERVSSGSELQPKQLEDPRVTSRFAGLCRKYSLDELPQLWHVMCGDMALIGPRPLTAREIVTFYGSDAQRLLLVRPGLSGLWQVNGRSRLTLEERRSLDLFMLENWSFRLYLRILRATIPCVLSGRNAW